MSSHRHHLHGMRLPLSAAGAVLISLTATSSAAAQQRVEVGARRAPRAEPADSTLRRLQRQLDSLTRTYNESEELTNTDRRRIGEEIGRMVRRLSELTRTDETLDNAARVGEMRIRLSQEASERAAAAMSRSMMQVRELQAAMPRGWIGIVVEGPGLEPKVEHGEYLVRYLSYPRIVSVDPSSPAERAGLIPSDTLIAYDGRDVRDNDISLTRLLEPNAHLKVTVRRDGRVREFPVTVAAVPSRVTVRRGDEVRDMGTSWVVAGVPSAPGFPRAGASTGTLSPAAPSRVVVRSAPRVEALPPQAPASGSAMPPAAPRAMNVFFFNGVAGAQLATITEGLGKSVGVTSGVLVLAAPVGSPAAESGLMDGDVITKVGGQVVQSISQVRDLVRTVSENGERAVELEILRQKRTQRITLKW